MNTTKFQFETAKELLSKKRAILEMDCRMGKSRIALEAAKDLNPIIVCPPSLVLNWKNEIKLVLGDIDLTIIKTTEKSRFKSYTPNCVIVDECHQSNKWKTSRELFSFCKKSKYLFLLTATNLINNPSDLYWALKLCYAHNMTFREYAFRYCSAEINYKNILMLKEPSNIEELKEMRQRVSVIRRRKLKLVKENIVLENTIDIDKIDFQNYATFQKLRAIQVLNDKRIKKILKDLLFKHKKIIYFYFHKLVKDTLCPSDRFIDGGTPFRNRESRIKRFKKEDLSYLFVNYKSGGVGLDIKAKAVVFIEQTWSPALDYQAYMRAYGFNRDDPLHIYYINLNNEKKLLVSSKKQTSNKGLIIDH